MRKLSFFLRKGKSFNIHDGRSTQPPPPPEFFESIPLRSASPVCVFLEIENCGKKRAIYISASIYRLSVEVKCQLVGAS